MTKNELINESKLLGLELTEIILNNLDKYKDLLIEWNKKFNLTSITKEEDIYLKHFYDSMCLVKAVDFSKKTKLCDFGTGAGFPGVVIAILFKNINVVLIESNGKKVSFLNMVKEEIGLKNVTIINDRIEEYGKNNKELYDVVTCRAVSNLGIISELSISILKVGGLFTPLKSNIEAELIKYTHDIENMGYKLIKLIEYRLPIENSYRAIPILLKQKSTSPKIPRNYNIILNYYNK